MSNHGPLRRGASPEVALEALGDFGAPGEVAELEKNLIDRPLLLTKCRRRSPHAEKVQGDFARRDRVPELG
jgi:hypothetical protein